MLRKQSSTSIQSLDLTERVQRFLLQIDETFHYQATHMGIKVTVPCTVKIRKNEERFQVTLCVNPH